MPDYFEHYQRVAVQLAEKARQYEATAAAARAKLSSGERRTPSARHALLELAEANEEAARIYRRRAEELKRGSLTAETRMHIRRRSEEQERRRVWQEKDRRAKRAAPAKAAV